METSPRGRITRSGWTYRTRGLSRWARMRFTPWTPRRSWGSAEGRCRDGEVTIMRGLPKRSISSNHTISATTSRSFARWRRYQFLRTIRYRQQHRDHSLAGARDTGGYYGIRAWAMGKAPGLVRTAARQPGTDHLGRQERVRKSRWDSRAAGHRGGGVL